MKNSVSIITIILVVIFSYSFSDPGNSKLLLVNGMGISLSLNDESQKNIFTSAEYSNEYEFVLLETKREMNYIQLINNKGVIEKEIQVMSKNVQIKKSTFKKGKYLMGLKINGVSKIEFINVLIE